MWPSGSELFLYLFSSKIGIFHKFLYRTFWYSRNYTYFYFPKWRYKPRMVLKITNLHILRYLPTCWLYLLECYTIDNQRCTHTVSEKLCKKFPLLFKWKRCTLCSLLLSMHLIGIYECGNKVKAILLSDRIHIVWQVCANSYWEKIGCSLTNSLKTAYNLCRCALQILNGLFYHLMLYCDICVTINL